MRKIAVITGTRAEYGLMYWLMKYLHEDKTIDFQLIVTGMHLSTEFGLTYKQIEKDGFQITKKIEIMLSSDTEIGISKSMGLAQISFAEVYDELKPDLLIVLGDRYEIFSAVASAMIAKIPIAHLHGGEATRGLIDEPIRHSLTKMSHLHFTATETYNNRVIQLGENPDTVFNVGTTGLDNIYKLSLLNKRDFESSINFKLNKNNILVTFHPVTLEDNTAEKQFQEILNSLEVLKDTNIIFTKANSDTNGRIINNMIDLYVNKHKENSIAFASLGQLRYLSALQYVDIVLGNSSSGLTEAPSFKIATINIGERQLGRIKADSVIDTEPIKKNILAAIKKAKSPEFKSLLKSVKNPYGEGGASEKIYKIIKNISLEGIIKKEFYDIL